MRPQQFLHVAQAVPEQIQFVGQALDFSVGAAGKPASAVTAAASASFRRVPLTGRIVLPQGALLCRGRKGLTSCE